MMDEFDRKMIEAGCVEGDLKTAAYKRAKEAVSKNPEIPYENGCPKYVSDAKFIMEQLEQYVDMIRSGDVKLIENREIRDAALCFRETLKAVKEVFGEDNLTEMVMCQAIEAGSYMGYRTIMGQASQPFRK